MARYSFGPFLLDPEARVLLRGGVPVSMTGKTLDTLLVLIQNRGRLVDKDELLSRIWPGTVVEEANLSQHIFTLRKVLDDTPKDRRYIATIAGRGYQFVAPVAELQTVIPIRAQVELESAAIPKGKRRFLIGVTILIVAASLSVLWVTLHHGRPETQELKVQQLTTNSSEMPISAAAISPDGKYLAYGALNEIYLRLIAAGETRLVARPQSLPSEDMWFPVAWVEGGARILASSLHSTREGQVFTAWTIPIIGGSPTRVRDNVFVHSVSPDGSFIVFTAGRDRSFESYPPNLSFPNIDKEIWIMGRHGEDARRIAAADNLTFFGAVQWSPDGSRLAYIKARLVDRGLTDMSIETRHLNGGAPSTILTNFRGRTFCWSPDGRILYTSPEPLPNNQDTSLWAISVDPKSGKPTNRPRKIRAFPGFGIEQLGTTADGKRLVFEKDAFQATALVAKLGPGPTVQGMRRLTFDERSSYPCTWTSDSKSIIFTSNRTGAFAIYKQSLDRTFPELIPSGPESVSLARMSPDATWIVYGAYSNARNPDKSTSLRLMRVPVTGGAHQPILETDAKNFNFDCPRVSTAPCVIEERRVGLKEAVFSAFDPLGGRRGEIFRVAVQADDFLQWTISPDGSRLALVNSDPGNPGIKIVSRSGTVDRSFEVKGWPHPMSVDWAADSKALLLSFRERGGTTLARVDLNGNAKRLYNLGDSNFTYAVASPDGQWLAIYALALSGRNVWMLEDF